MAETANLRLPFLAAGQAQKHVTVNEALARLDMLVMLSVRSRTVSAPPASPLEGDRYIAPTGAIAAWAGRAGEVAIFSNGGWIFAAPAVGWRAFIEDESGEAVFAAGVWNAVATPAPTSGVLSTLEFEHSVAPGASNVTAATVPAGVLVFGVTARVREALTGVEGWSLGHFEAETRYGTGLPVAAGSAVTGARGAPLAHLAPAPFVLTAEGGAFAGGRIAFAMHFLHLPAPAVA